MGKRSEWTDEELSSAVKLERGNLTAGGRPVTCPALDALRKSLPARNRTGDRRVTHREPGT